MKNSFNFYNLLKHPLIVAIIIGIFFNIAISKYSNDTAQNNTIIQLGFIPSRQAYTQCIDSVNQLGNDYYNIRYQAKLINGLLSQHSETPAKIFEIIKIENALESYETKANAAYTTQINYCDHAYIDLEFASQILRKEKPFNQILRKRNASIEAITNKQALLQSKLDGLKATSLIKLNTVFLPKNPNASNAQIWIFKAENLYGTSFIKIYDELLLLQHKKFKLERNYYSLARNMLEKTLIKRLHKNIWQYIF